MNLTNKTAFKIAAVGDLHVHEHSKNLYHDMFVEVSGKADLLVLCGDLTTMGTAQEALNLAEDVSAATIPVLAVLANHDYNNGQELLIKQALTQAKVHFLEDEPFELEGLSVVGTKGFGGGFDKHILTAFGEQAIKNFVNETIRETLRLENWLREFDGKKTIAVLHYSPIAATVAGEPPEIFPFLGSSRLEDTLDHFNIAAI